MNLNHFNKYQLTLHRTGCSIVTLLQRLVAISHAVFQVDSFPHAGQRPPPVCEKMPQIIPLTLSKEGHRHLHKQQPCQLRLFPLPRGSNPANQEKQPPETRVLPQTHLALAIGTSELPALKVWNTSGCM